MMADILEQVARLIDTLQLVPHFALCALMASIAFILRLMQLKSQRNYEDEIRALEEIATEIEKAKKYSYKEPAPDPDLEGLEVIDSTVNPFMEASE